MLYFILGLLLMNVFSTTEESDRPVLKSQRKKPFAAVVFTSTSNYSPSDKEPCQWLARLKHQSKICWKRQGLSKVLLYARNLSIFHCETQFMFNRWNCSRREFFFKNIYRETAVMYSIASSAVMFSVVKGCSDGTLPGCRCGDPGKVKNPSPKWKWGGCSDNTKFAKRFTRKFLQLNKKGDGYNSIVRYNSEIGIKVVLESEEKICVCHGLSASCATKICHKIVRPFQIIIERLKNLYHHADYVQPENSIRPYKSDKKPRGLLYLVNSTNLCNTTHHRHCYSEENCATLCCGRETYIDQVRSLNGTCRCRWRDDLFNVTCKACLEEKEILRCL